ncbi:MAG: UDP-N-acetylglucosamine--LPS N-acetylglucosamine transferase [bacterium]|nr:UDP-N-acetylglucosamine--LPS N-acetylglucosamine transferase [bacterium]
MPAQAISIHGKPCKPFILLLHASVGSGHMTAAKAIAQALDDLKAAGFQVCPEQPLDYEVEVVDSLEFGRIKFDGNKVASSFIGPWRGLYDIWWRYFLTGRIVWNGGTGWLRVMFPRFADYVRERKPDAIVCTHITAANIAVGARMATKQDFPIICVPTDYEVEGQFPAQYTDLFCTASRYMTETLLARKVRPDRILETGIPIRPDFTNKYDKSAERKRWDLPANKKIGLMMTGASLPKPYERLRATLMELMPRLRDFPNMMFVFIAGKDEGFKSRVEAAAQAAGLTNVRVLGYVDGIASLMAACDFTVCKPGGLSSTECLCSDLPMILVGDAYGQEKVNVRMLTAAGASLHAFGSDEIHSLLQAISKSDTVLDGLIENSRKLKKPYAAIDIATATLDLAYARRDEQTLAERRKWHGLIGWGHKPAHRR